MQYIRVAPTGGYDKIICAATAMRAVGPLLKQLVNIIMTTTRQL